MEINVRIFELLDKQNKKAKDLAKYIGVSASSVSAWKTENSSPSSKHIIRISEFFNVSIEYLLVGTNNKISEITLSSDESELIETYKKLDRRGQHRVHTVIYEEIDRIKGEKPFLSKEEIKE